MAAEQVFRIQGHNDAAAVLGDLADDPTNIGSKARNALKLENPGTVLKFEKI